MWTHRSCQLPVQNSAQDAAGGRCRSQSFINGDRSARLNRALRALGVTFPTCRTAASASLPGPRACRTVAPMTTHAAIAELTADASALRRRYVDLVVTQALSMPLSSLLSEQALIDIVQAHCEKSAVEQLFVHVQPIVDRCRKQLAAKGGRAQDWVASEVQASLPKLLTNPNGPRFSYIKGVIDPALLRRLLAPVLQDVLLRFVARLSTVLGSAGSGLGGTDGGLLGRLGRDVGGKGKRLLDVGLSMVSGLGLEQKLQELAADFSQHAVGAFRDSLAERLRSPEGQNLVRAMVEQGTNAVLQTPLSELNADLDRIPLSELLALIPHAVAHAASQQLFGEMLQSEVKGYYAKHGGRPWIDLLRDLNLEDPIRGACLVGVEEHARLLFASEGFATWLSDLTVLSHQS